MTGKSVRSSQEALAVAIRDYLLNAGIGKVKRDAILAFIIWNLTKPLQKNHDEELQEIRKKIVELIEEYTPVFDNPEYDYCSPMELKYIVELTEQFGLLWSIIHEEEIIPANMIMRTEAMEK